MEMPRLIALPRIALVALVAALLPACAAAWPENPQAVLTIKPPATLVRRNTGVLVQMDTSDPLDLEVKVGPDDDDWSQACTAPCGAHVPAGATCRVVRNGAPVTSDFVVDGPDGATAVLRVGGTPPVYSPRHHDPILSPMM
jgi:hypothetical protein